MADIPGEESRGDQPSDGCSPAPDRKPLPARFGAAWSIAIDRGQGHRRQYQQQRPPENSDGEAPKRREADGGKDHRSDDHRSKRDHERQDRDEREQEGEKVELHEAAFFLLVIDDVERVDDRLHSGVGAPKGDRKSGYETEAELCIAFCRKPRDLFVKYVDRACGKNARGQRKMGVNRRGVRDQSVERDECAIARKNASSEKKTTPPATPSRRFLF